MGHKNLAQRLRIPPVILAKVKSAKTNWADIASKIAPDSILRLENEVRVRFDRKRNELAELCSAIEIEGLRTVARKRGVDPSNLRRLIASTISTASTCSNHTSSAIDLE